MLLCFCHRGDHNYIEKLGNFCLIILISRELTAMQPNRITAVRQWGAWCASCKSAIKRQLGTISEDVHAIVEHRQEEDEKEATISEWRQIAHAFDRFGLLLFILATIILAIILDSELKKNTPD